MVEVGFREGEILMGCEKHMVDALIASDQLMDLASKQGTECGHDGCLVLDGILRDCAMQIRRVVADSEARLVISPGHPENLESQPTEWPRTAVGARQ